MHRRGAGRTKRGWLAVVLCMAGVAHAEVALPPIFSDGMVLQRDRPIPVWGTAAAGERVRIAFRGRRVAAVADAHGRWRAVLPPQSAGGPYRMRIDGAGAPHVLRDVLIGDVWLASGQSNMEWPLSRAANAEAEIARATDPAIRHFKVPHGWSGSPQAQLDGGVWIVASPAEAGRFSAVAHLFARDLRAATGVPIGIVESTWGGSRIEAWMAPATLGLDPLRIDEDARRLQAAEDARRRETQRRLARWPPLPADDADWSSPQLDDRDWAEIPVPGAWESAGWAALDGIAWYRTAFELDATQAKRGVRLSLARIDDSDSVWVNGVFVGGLRDRWDAPRRYEVPSSALRAGRNVVAVRVEDGGGGGGIHGAAEEVCVSTYDIACMSLAMSWRFRVAKAAFAEPDGVQRMPSLLYHRMIHPLRDVPLRGAIWYQGESNADTAEDAVRYRDAFVAMIRQWRREWNAPELPFLWVQLAGYASGRDTASDSPWAVLRESQSAALALPAAGQAVAIDLGTPDDIHPPNKQDVAHRLAREALRVAYGDVRIAPPTAFARADIVDGAGGGALRVRFGPSGATLRTRGGGDAPGGFEVAGEDRVFHPAQARIEGDVVIVRNAEVAAPRAVRYGWRDHPAAADLIDGAGLPISPFRADAR